MNWRKNIHVLSAFPEICLPLLPLLSPGLKFLCIRAYRVAGLLSPFCHSCHPLSCYILPRTDATSYCYMMLHLTTIRCYVFRRKLVGGRSVGRLQESCHPLASVIQDFKVSVAGVAEDLSIYIKKKVDAPSKRMHPPKNHL